ncbi:MAG TPA: SMP-30/gluconolactonase/LRE family protein [Xanthobacteraceae bacterium]|jgi:sugar lactone lactonase YvrE
MNNKLKNFTLHREDFSVFGRGLTRPECVRADQEGVWASDDRGGIARVTENGVAELRGEGVYEPNGYSRTADGAFIVAGLKDNKVFRIDRGGRVSVVLDEFQGKPLGTVNTAWADGNGRIWVSMMTRQERWYQALNTQPDGYILLIEEGQARIVADELHLTNEVKVHPNGRHLYGVETLGKRVFRFAIGANGDLGQKEIFGPADLGHGALPDGFIFDEDGNVWVTIISRNGIVVLNEAGETHTIYEEANVEAVDAMVAALQQGIATPEHFVACAGKTLNLPTSLSFGGADGRTVYVGSLGLPHLVTFSSPVAGLPLY